MRILNKFIYIIFGLLIGGCASINNPDNAIQHEISYQIENITKKDVKRIAKINRTKDIDILQNFGDPYSIQQFSDDRKQYLYSYMKIEDVSPEKKRSRQKNIIFKFDQRNKLTFWDFFEKNSHINVSAQKKLVFPEVENSGILMRMIERIPRNTNKSGLKKYLGEPTDITSGDFYYEYQKSSSKFDFSKPEFYKFTFEFKKNNVIRNILLDKNFYEEIKNDAKFNMNIVTWEFRDTTQEEKEVIEKYNMLHRQKK